MAYVIRLLHGEHTRPVYATEAGVLAALKRRPVGAQAWWCKYGRETKMLIATRTENGIEKFDVEAAIRAARGEA
jgi:hypothetical protein